MSELPPDVPRLRAILEHLEKQAADNETVGIYLRLQRDKVATALAQAEAAQPRKQKQKRPRPTSLPQMPAYAQAREPTRYKIVHRAADGSEFASLHLGDCDIDEGPTRWLDAHEATVALADGVAGCVFCRPYDVLGFSQD